MRVYDYIYKNITLLKTPVGDFYVTNRDSYIPFSVKPNPFNLPYETNHGKNNVTINSPETNYVIEIAVSSLKVGETYKICFSSGNLSFCDSDERKVALSKASNGWIVGIGAYNPNDDEELEQATEYSKEIGCYEKNCIIDPPEFDVSEFQQYQIWSSEDKRGFTFKLLDKSREKICFWVAWIQCKNLSEDDCDSAIGYWLT